MPFSNLWLLRDGMLSVGRSKRLLERKAEEERLRKISLSSIQIHLITAEYNFKLSNKDNEQQQ